MAHCFHALDEIQLEEDSWDLTTRAQLALYQDSEDVHEVLFKRRANRTEISVCNRLVIETAQYSCVQDGGRSFSAAEHLTVLADVKLLLFLANHREAIEGAFMKPEIVIAPNGELDVDEKFYIKVISQYFTRRGREASEQAAKEYIDRFSGKEKISKEDSTKLDTALDEFDKIFLAEFGFDLRSLLEVLAQLRQLAIFADMPGGEMNQELIMNYLLSCGLDSSEATAFLKCFTLPIRSGWDKDLPSTFKKYDVYPWRQRRQLSLLFRPLVQVKTVPPTWVISVPLFEKYIEYWLNCIEFAHLPREFFRSKEMHDYIDRNVNKRGHEFVQDVLKVFKSAGNQTAFEIELTQLGAPKKLGLGDLDVLAWKKNSKLVHAVECKRLLPATSVREIVQRLEDFGGNRKEMDSLGRHLRRIDWLRNNLASVSKFTGIPEKEIQLNPLLVTSEIMPMEFYKEMNFPTSQVVSFNELAKRIFPVNK